MLGSVCSITVSCCQAGAEVNVSDSKMRTPLSEAVEKGHMNIVEVLLKAGATADQKVICAFLLFLVAR